MKNIMGKSFLPQHGGFRKLRSFQAAQLAYDGTVIFCDRFIDKRSRTNDQMVQAARSGVQNIAEGSLASATSKETELKLTNVARASLGELLLDYEDFLRQRGLRQWTKESPEALEVRRLYLSDLSDIYAFRTASAEVVANTLICLVNQASSLLHRQIRQLEQEFLAQGGLRERMTRARLEVRGCCPTSPTCPTSLTSPTGPTKANRLPAQSAVSRCGSVPPEAGRMPVSLSGAAPVIPIAKGSELWRNNLTPPHIIDAPARFC
ncbi:four helix bundle suffix domain-containing protein [Geobacter sp. DSM 9736]|nr:four helix bundle suffix domain-containing protein [Geobacter sp. DSM 9736]